MLKWNIWLTPTTLSSTKQIPSTRRSKCETYLWAQQTKTVLDHITRHLTNRENMAPSLTLDPFPSQQRECSQRLHLEHNEHKQSIKNREDTAMKRVGLINTRISDNPCGGLTNTYKSLKLSLKKSVSISEKKGKTTGRKMADKAHP